MAAHTTTHEGIAGLSEEFAKKFDTLVAPNRELLLLIDGVVPERIQARDHRTNELIFNDGQPVWLTDPRKKMHQLQRYVRLVQNGISKLRDEAAEVDEAKQKAKEEEAHERLKTEIRLLETQEKACSVDGLELKTVKEKLKDKKLEHRSLERFLTRKVAELSVAEGQPPKRRRVGKGVNADNSTAGGSASSSSNSAPAAAGPVDPDAAAEAQLDM
jgi:hypothetical protein